MGYVPAGNYKASSPSCSMRVGSSSESLVRSRLLLLFFPPNTCGAPSSSIYSVGAKPNI